MFWPRLVDYWRETLFFDHPEGGRQNKARPFWPIHKFWKFVYFYQSKITHIPIFNWICTTYLDEKVWTPLQLNSYLIIIPNWADKIIGWPRVPKYTHTVLTFRMVFKKIKNVFWISYEENNQGCGNVHVMFR